MPTPKQGYTNRAGQPIPGCTTVMKALGSGSTDALCHWAAGLAKRGLSWLDERDRAGKLGSYVHDVLEQYPAPLPPREPWLTQEEWDRVVAAYSSYAEWCAQIQPKVLHHEVQLVSEELQFGGCFDAVIELGGEPILLDFKTGKTKDVLKWAIQLGGYRQLIAENGLVSKPIRRGLVLHFPAGKFRPVEISPEQLDAGFELFKVARRAHSLFDTFPRS